MYCSIYISGHAQYNFFIIRHEQEADFIGMFLSASAGYDPQVAPVVLRNKTGKDGPCPFMAKRIESISHPQVMQEAVAIYQKKHQETRY